MDEHELRSKVRTIMRVDRTGLDTAKCMHLDDSSAAMEDLVVAAFLEVRTATDALNKIAEALATRNSMERAQVLSRLDELERRRQQPAPKQSTVIRRPLNEDPEYVPVKRRP